MLYKPRVAIVATDKREKVAVSIVIIDLSEVGEDTLPSMCCAGLAHALLVTGVAE